MSNTLRQDIRPKAIKITLDRERTLRFDLNAFAEREERFGDMETAFSAMQNGSMKAARTLLWAGLVHEDESLTEKQVGSLITIDKLKPIMDLITGAINDALPDVSPNEADTPTGDGDEGN